MGKKSALAAILLTTTIGFVSGLPNTPVPKPPVTLISTPHYTDLTAISSEGVFSWEDNGNDGVDKVSEWFKDMPVPTTFTKVSQAQQAACDNISNGYLKSEIKTFVDAYKNNSALMEFFTPFGTDARNGRAVLYTSNGAIEYKLLEGADGTLTLRVGTPIRRWGESGDTFLEIKDAAVGSKYRDLLDGLRKDLTTINGGLATDSYTALEAMFSDSPSK